MTYFEPAPPRILAHRGFALHAPENTAEAFAAALDLGVTHLETDVHLTRDGYAVLWHDPDLRRWNGERTRIDRLSIHELQNITVRGATISTVAEALAEFPQAKFNIDVKDDRAVDAVADAIEWVAATDRVLVTSFHESTCAALRARIPDAFHGASMQRVARALVSERIGNEAALARILAPIDAVQVPPRMRGVPIATRRRIAAFKRHVREVHVWTINDPAEMRELVERGVDGIVTDRADRAIELDG